MAIKKKDGFSYQRHVIIPMEILEQTREHRLLKNAYIQEAGYYPNAKYHYRQRNSGATDYICIYCIDGSGTIELGKQIFALERGEIFFIPPAVPHIYHSNASKPWSILWIHFQMDATNTFDLPFKKVIRIKSREKNALLQRYFIDLFDAGEAAASPKRLAYLSQLLQLILTTVSYLEEDLASDPQQTYLHKAIQFMLEHLREDITLEDLCRHLKISSSYISAIFNRYTGKSPIDYLIDMRVEQACRLLKLSDMKIYEIAKRVGYHDQYYFSRTFKKKMGIPPKDYRKTVNIPLRNQST